MKISKRLALGLLLFAVCLHTPQTSHADLPSNLFIQSQEPGITRYRINEYDTSSALVINSYVPPARPMSSGSLFPQDIVVNQAQQLHLFNGSFDPYLATLDLNTGIWSQQTHLGWSGRANASRNGIGQIGDNVFVTDASASTSGSSFPGLVVFNETSETSVGIAPGIDATDLATGLDGSLWVLSGNDALQFDPVSFAQIGTVSLSAATGSDIRSIAVDANGDFFVGDWDGFVSRLDASGNFISSFDPASLLNSSLPNSIIDVDISHDGQLAIGTRFKGTWLSNRQLDPAIQIESNRRNSFVAFAPVPEPTTCGLVLIATLCLAIGIRPRPTP